LRLCASGILRDFSHHAFEIQNAKALPKLQRAREEIELINKVSRPAGAGQKMSSHLLDMSHLNMDDPFTGCFSHLNMDCWTIPHFFWDDLLISSHSNLHF
jgi:hypothetical protein